MNKLKYEIQSIDIKPFEVQDVPGINVPQINYGSAIGGKDAPEAGADVTYNNPQAMSWVTNAGALATKDVVDTAEIVDGAVEKVKMALLSVDADIIAAAAITESKLFTGAVTADKVASNAITSAKILAGAVIAGKIAANAVTATEINVSTLSAISANIGTITAGAINGVIITGGTIQTDTGTYPKVKITSTGIDIHGQSMEFRSISDGSLQGEAYVDGAFRIKGSTGRNLVLSAGSHIYLQPTGDIILTPTGLDVYPGDDNTINLGTSVKTWKTIYGQIVYAQDKLVLTNYDVLDTYLTTVYLKGRGGDINIQPTSGTTKISIKSSGNAVEVGGTIKAVSGDIICEAGNLQMNKTGALVAIKDSGGTVRYLSVKYNATLGVYILST